LFKVTENPMRSCQEGWITVVLLLLSNVQNNMFISSKRDMVGKKAVHVVSLHFSSACGVKGVPPQRSNCPDQKKLKKGDTNLL
jgi:hypothetical protein